jgi:hypothetical protein
MMHAITTIVKAHVCGYMSWFVPKNVSFKAIPRAFTLMTCTVQQTSLQNIQLKNIKYKDANLVRTYRDGTYERANTNIHHDMGLSIKWNKLAHKYSN